MNTFNPLERIIYITLPEGSSRTIGSFSIDSTIRLPVELPPDKESFDIEELSWEMIASGMLKIFAYEPSHTHADYYREFIFAMQPNLAAQLTQAGIIKAEAGELALAQEIFLALAHLCPQDENIRLNLAFVYEQQMLDAEKSGDTLLQEAMEQKAYGAYHDLTEVFSESANIHYYAGSFFLKLENFLRAKEHFELFLGLSPEDERSAGVRDVIEQISRQNEDDQHFALAFDLIKLGREQEALEHADLFLSSHPSVWNGWFLKGWALRRLNRFKEAEAALLNCAGLETRQTDVFNELAICQMELGKFSECRDSLKKALALEPENVKIISNFGVLALKMGNKEEAVSFFRSAREIDPKDPAAGHYLEMLESQ